MVIVSVSTGRRSGDRRGDDVGLGGQALHPRGDDVGAKLVEQQEADHQHDEAAEIEDDDAAGERRREARRQEAPGDARARDAATDGSRAPAERQRDVRSCVSALMAAGEPPILP